MAELPSFQALRYKILTLAELQPTDRLVDVGAGTGLLTLAAAAEVKQVIALDISERMCMRLESHCRRLGITNVQARAVAALELPLGDEEIDVVVSNYCFHHMSDRQKRRALEEIHRILRPGGRLVFCDMMFRVGVVRARDRAILALLARRMLTKGLAGLLRLAKNGVRFLTGRWEHPASVEWWRQALDTAGFTDVRVWPLDHEGGLATARRARDSGPQVAPGR